MKAILGSVVMKRCFQFVALSIVTLLAIPPALAAGLCLAPQASQQMECCANSGGTPQAQVPTAPALAQACTESCCSVSPQSTPLPTVPEKATTLRAPLVQGNPLTALVPQPALAVWHDSQPSALAIDRQVRLHVFRI